MPIGNSNGQYFENAFEQHKAGELLPPAGDEKMVVTPNDMMTNKQLNQDSITDDVLGGTEVSYKPGETRLYVSPRRPPQASAEPAGEFKSGGGSQTPESSPQVNWAGYNQPFGTLTDTNPAGATIATIASAKKMGLEGADITERDINKATDIAMSSGPNMVVGARVAFPGDEFWKKSFRAAAMENRGATPKEILQETGMFRKTPNGRWVAEISDDTMSLADRDWRYGETGKLSEFINHPKLFEAYPELKDVNFKVADKDFDYIGGYNSSTNTLTINPARIPSGDEGILDVVAHEIQHWVQTKEGFPLGSNPDEALRDAVHRLGRKIMEEQDPEARGGMMKLMTDIAHNARAFAEYMYQRVPGEIEANSTLARRKLTEQQRKDFPIEEFNKFMEGSDNTMSGGKYYPPFHYPTPGKASDESAISKVFEPQSPRWAHNDNVRPLNESEQFIKDFDKLQELGNSLGTPLPNSKFGIQKKWSDLDYAKYNKAGREFAKKHGQTWEDVKPLK